MRYFAILALGIFALALAGNASAFNVGTDAAFFDLSAWDHAAIKNGQQTFENVYEDVDLTISVAGDFSLPTGVLRSGWVHSSNLIVGAQQFSLTFSEPVPLVIQHDTTDPSEEFRVLGAKTDDYVQQKGAPVSSAKVPGGISVSGSAFRITENGAARGYMLLQPTSSLTIEHVALSEKKFERFKVGVNTIFSVPEPQGVLCFLVTSCLLLVSKLRNSAGLHRQPG